MVDDFRIEDCAHNGGMATLWCVSRPGSTMPMLMKMPKIGEGEDPAAIVSFEMEQMILPRLSGIHVPKFVATGDFAVQPYIVMERIGGATLLARRARSSAALCRRRRDRRESRDRPGRPASAACHPSRRQAEQHHVPAGGRSRADRLRPFASRSAAGPDAGGVSPAVRQRALYGAGAIAWHPARPEKRPVRLGCLAVFLLDRRAAVRRKRDVARDASAALA